MQVFIQILMVAFIRLACVNKTKGLSVLYTQVKGIRMTTNSKPNPFPIILAQSTCVESKLLQSWMRLDKASEISAVDGKSVPLEKLQMGEL